MDSNSSKSVSTFDLEPNPFEQSFASTKEPRPRGPSFELDNGSRGAAIQKLEGVDVVPNESVSATVVSSNANANVIGNTTGSPLNSEVVENSTMRHYDGAEKGKLSSLMYGAERPNIHSPPQLTPGGSNRLPPILLSPSYMQHNAISGSGLNGVPHHQLTGHVPLATSLPTNMSSGATTAESLKTGYFVNLPKTGLTPNESSMRTGLTPILGTGHNLVHHPPFNTLPSFSNVKPEPNFHDVENNRQKQMNNTNSNSLELSNSDTVHTAEAATLTPGLGSMLGLTNNPTSSQLNSAIHVNENGIIRDSDKRSVKQEGRSSITKLTAAKVPLATAVPIDPAGSIMNKTKTKSFSAGSPPQNNVRKRKSSSFSKTSRTHKKNQNSAAESPQYDNVSKENSDDDDQERKRKEFLERNRVAASKFRRRKKEYIKKVEVDLKFYESEYDDMSQAIDKLCGIAQKSGYTNENKSLIAMLETTITKSDVPSSLSILAHIKQVLQETRYFQRGGVNPRGENLQHDSDDEDRHPSDQGTSIRGRSRQASTSSGTGQRKNSLDDYNGMNSRRAIMAIANQSNSSESNTSFSTDTTTMSSNSKKDAETGGFLPVSISGSKGMPKNPIASAIGTISTLPNVINGTQVISLPANELAVGTKAMSGQRQNSFSDLTSDSVKLATKLEKFPNST